MNRIVIVPFEISEGLIFCGYIDGGKRFKSGNINLSRMHKQPNRIYNQEGIHPALSASETQGRYYIMVYE